MATYLTVLYSILFFKWTRRTKEKEDIWLHCNSCNISFFSPLNILAFTHLATNRRCFCCSVITVKLNCFLYFFSLVRNLSEECQRMLTGTQCEVRKHGCLCYLVSSFPFLTWGRGDAMLQCEKRRNYIHKRSDVRTEIILNLITAIHIIHLNVLSFFS